jgi:hypothetical protein
MSETQVGSAATGNITTPPTEVAPQMEVAKTTENTCELLTDRLNKNNEIIDRNSGNELYKDVVAHIGRENTRLQQSVDFLKGNEMDTESSKGAIDFLVDFADGELTMSANDDRISLEYRGPSEKFHTKITDQSFRASLADQYAQYSTRHLARYYEASDAISNAVSRRENPELSDYLNENGRVVVLGAQQYQREQGKQ